MSFYRMLIDRRERVGRIEAEAHRSREVMTAIRQSVADMYQEATER